MFDEQPDGDPHGECAQEIHRLQALIREALSEYSIGYVLGTDWVERAQAAIADA